MPSVGRVRFDVAHVLASAQWRGGRQGASTKVHWKGEQAGQELITSLTQPFFGRDLWWDPVFADVWSMHWRTLKVKQWKLRYLVNQTLASTKALNFTSPLMWVFVVMGYHPWNKGSHESWEVSWLKQDLNQLHTCFTVFTHKSSWNTLPKKNGSSPQKGPSHLLTLHSRKPSS